MAPPIPWTDEDDAILHRMWMIERISASIIGERLGGRSRSAIIGRAHRKGWKRQSLMPKVARPYPRRASEIARRGELAPNPRGITFGNGGGPAPKPPTHVEMDDMARTDGHRIIDDEFKGCKWPIRGEGADTYFCCRPTAGQTYCEGHARRALNPSQPNVKDLVRQVTRLARRAA